ncbi:DUF3598 family protein [[Phormidium] sp. ETS-05]|uniref:DUF3598 family protein n=1 Tax=[Phormidium] sp. ETS-05 TaxID=222819 RepID=UPI0018EF1A1F|nr:DUF3598 family protein [[Phormidium] sp. ETS-05]
MSAQWDNFLKNLGVWEGSFTQISPQGEILGSTPSILTLEGLDDNQRVRFHIRRFQTNSNGETTEQAHTQEFQSLGRHALFFDNGAFSKGNMQLAPFSEFVSEFGFVEGDRRLRFVQQFNKENQFTSLTLIRETRADSGAVESPPLTLAQLLGKWEGTACTMYPDWRRADIYPTTLEIKDIGGGYIEQNLSFAGKIINSKGRVDGNTLHFDQGSHLVQVLLLPGGGSATQPPQLPLRQAFFFEVGWLVQPGWRQRLIRSYSDKGEWLSSTLVNERLVSEG